MKKESQKPNPKTGLFNTKEAKSVKTVFNKGAVTKAKRSSGGHVVRKGSK